MTPDMAFECLLVSQDSGVVSIMNKLLSDLAISTSVCPTPARAFDRLLEGGTDLVIMDWQNGSTELLQHITRSGGLRKPAVMVVSDIPNAVSGTHSLLHKPITEQSGVQSLKKVYSKLLQDYRQHKRCVLRSSLIAKNQYGRAVPITVTDVGEGGLGLNTEEFLSRGDLLSFVMLLPGSDLPIDVEARVLWMRQYGAAGCEFTSIPQADRGRLHDWLEQKGQVKKPLVELWGD